MFVELNQTGYFKYDNFRKLNIKLLKTEIYLGYELQNQAKQHEILSMQFSYTTISLFLISK